METSFDNYVGRFNWIDQEGKRILLLEFYPGSEKEATKVLDLLVRELAKAEEGSVLLLADLRYAGYSAALALEWQKHQDLLTQKCTRVAIVGLHGVISVAVTTFVNLAKSCGFEITSKLKVFNRNDLAKSWLVQMTEERLPVAAPRASASQ